MPKVSVILPTYNRAKTLRAASESVLNQSYRNLELLVVDDASTDNVAAVVHNLADERVRYLRRECNGGAAAARNTGLAAATGEFIAFQDSDDLWLPGKLEWQLSLFDMLPPDVGLVFGAKIVYGRDKDFNYGPGRVACAPAPGSSLTLEEDQVRAFLVGNRLSLQNALFRRDCFPERSWFDPCAKANEEWEFAARLVRHTRVYEDSRPVVLAFISGDSISTGRRKKALGLLRLAKTSRSTFAQYPDALAIHRMRMARALMKIGRAKVGRRLFLSALRTHPGLFLTLLGETSQRIAARLSTRLRRPRMTQAGRAG